MFKIIGNNKETAIIVLIFIFFALAFNIYRVQSDGLTYYAFLERILNVSRPESPLEDVRSAPFMQSGCAYFNIPFYMSAYLVESAIHKNFDFNGITLRQISVNLASNFYMILSLVLSIRILKKLYLKSLILPTLAVLFSTSAFAAAAVIPSWAHAVDIFVTTLFIYMLIDSSEKSAVWCLWVGMFFGICILVRYLNVILAVMAVLYYLNRKERRKLLFFLAGAAAAAWTLPLVLYSYNGVISPFHNTTLTAASTSARILFSKNFLKLLVHPLHGIFVWSPVTILSIFGLSQFPKDQARLGYAMLLTWVIFLLVNSSVYEWHGGWSFSNRYLVSFFPVYIVGLARVLDKYGKKAVPVVLAMMLWSIFLFFNWYQCIMHGEFGTIYDMFYNWASGRSSTSMEGEVNLKTFFSKIWTMCRYKHIFSILK